MTVPHTLLCGRVGSDPVQIQRKSREKYTEHDSDRVRDLIEAGCVEGVATRSGRVLFLRMVVDDSIAFLRVAEIRRGRDYEARSGSVNSHASATVFREHLSDSLWCWMHHPRCNSFARS